MRKAHGDVSPTYNFFPKLEVDLKKTALSLQKPGFGSGLGYYNYLKRGAPANFKGCSKQGSVGHRWGISRSTTRNWPLSNFNTAREVGGLHSQIPAESLGERPKTARNFSPSQVFLPIGLSFRYKIIACFSMTSM